MGYPYAPTARTGSLSESDYHADIFGLASAMVTTNINDYSNDVTEMQTTVSPGGLGSESLATDLAGELARIRYMIKLITGQAQWYIDPGATIAGASFAAGTKMLFQQTAAPAGWTKVYSADYNDSAFRCVTGAVNDPTVTNPTRSAFLATVMAQTTVGNHTLTTAEIPAHAHGMTAYGTAWGSGAAAAASISGGSVALSTNNAGSGSAHNHTVSMNIKYVDLIVATKN